MFYHLQGIGLEVDICEGHSSLDNTPTTTMLPVQIRQTLLLHIQSQINEQRI